jgi:hypothetical protein
MTAIKKVLPDSFRDNQENSYIIRRFAWQLKNSTLANRFLEAHHDKKH